VVYIASKDENGQVQRKHLTAGEGAPRGAVLTWTLPEKLPADTPIKLEFLNVDGDVLRTYKPKPAGYDKLDDKEKALDPGPWIPVQPGVNRFLWNLRVEGAYKLAGNKTAGELNEGPMVIPGSYTARLTVGDTVRTATFKALADPRVKLSKKAFAEQHALLLNIRDTVSGAYKQIERLRDVREQVLMWRKRLSAKAEIVQRADELLAELSAIEEVLIQPGEQKDTYHLTARPRLNEAMSSLVSVIGSADARPTASAAALVAEYAAAIQMQCDALDALLESKGAELSQLIVTQMEGALVL
jgi:hypothetical protein